VIYVLWATQQQGVDFAVQMAGRKDLIGSGIGELIRGELSRWRHFFQWPLGAPLAALFAGSWVAVWFRTDREDKCIATMIGLFVMALPVTTVNITSRYLVGMVPLFAMLVVRLVQSTVAPASPRATHVRFRRGFGALLGFMYVVTCVGAIGVLFVRLHDADLDRLLTRVADVVEPGARVCGEMILWMEHERFSYGPDPLEPSGGRASDDPERYRRFDYAARFAWTMFTSHGIAAPPASMPDWRPNHALDDICRRFGKRVASFRDPYYGPVEIYRLAIPPKNGVDTHDDMRR